MRDRLSTTRRAVASRRHRLWVAAICLVALGVALDVAAFWALWLGTQPLAGLAVWVVPVLALAVIAAGRCADDHEFWHRVLYLSGFVASVSGTLWAGLYENARWLSLAAVLFALAIFLAPHVARRRLLLVLIGLPALLVGVSPVITAFGEAAPTFIVASYRRIEGANLIMQLAALVVIAALLITGAWALRNRTRPGVAGAGLDASRRWEELRAALRMLGHPEERRLSALARKVDKLLAAGKPARALPLAQTAVELARSALAPDDPRVAPHMANLALVYERLGNIPSAATWHALAVERERLAAQPAPWQRGPLLSRVAAFHLRRGNLETAESLLQEALPLLRSSRWWKLKLERAYCLELLGHLALARGDHTTAEDRYLEALGIREEPEPGEDLDNVLRATAPARTNLGAVYEAQGRLSEAEARYRQAVSAPQRLFDRPPLHRASAWMHVARILRVVARSTSLPGLLLAALLPHDRRIGPLLEPIEGASARVGLARICAATGRGSEAWQLLATALGAQDRTLDQLLALGSEHERLAYLAALQADFALLLSLLLHDLHDSPTAVREACEWLLRRKGLSAEAAIAQRDVVLARRRPELAGQLAELRILRAQVAERTLAGPGPEGVRRHEKQLASWTQRAGQLETELARQMPEAGLAERLRRVASLAAVARALPPMSALVEFVCFPVYDFTARSSAGVSPWGQERYLAFVISAGAPDAVELCDLGPRAAVDAAISGFRGSIGGQGATGAAHAAASLTPISAARSALDADAGPATTGSAGDTLRSLVFDPLLHAIAGRTRLFIAPDGDLAHLPFGVLPSPAGGYLIDHYQFSYVSVARDLLRFGQSVPATPAPAVVVAAPDYDLADSTAIGVPPLRAESPRSLASELRRSGIHFRPLPGAHVEGDRVASILAATLLAGAAARESTVRDVRAPRILHLATHGFFLQSGLKVPPLPSSARRLALLYAQPNPMLRSGLALAGANTWARGGQLPAGVGDGVLTAAEVGGMDLVDTELVVLSACETGLGEIHSGEGVFGLRRAFELAGARTLVMSLWKVADVATQELIIDFYERLQGGAGRAAALEQAQQALRLRYPDPLYWGAFICQGDPAPLVSSPAGGAAFTTRPQSR